MAGQQLQVHYLQNQLSMSQFTFVHCDFFAADIINNKKCESKF